MRTLIRNAVVLLLLMTAVCGVAYPVVVTGVAQIVFPDASNGSLITRAGKPIGSSLIGQPFTDPAYFWSRPSATAPFPNNSGSSSGSNLGPTNAALTDAVGQRIAALRAADPANTLAVPVDLVTASGSGLDPDISVAAAQYQIPRVARARSMSVGEVALLVSKATRGRQLGLLGEPRVNVMALNLLLETSR